VRFLLAAALSVAAAAPCAAQDDEGTALPTLQTTSWLTPFYDSTGPMSYVAMTPRDVPAGARLIPEVRSVSCQRGLSIPTTLSLQATDVNFVYGDGGFVKCVRKIVKEHPEVAGIYDVRVDLEIFSILGIYKATCTIVTARAFALPGASPPVPPPSVPSSKS
jgi:hypothetical protein